MDFILVRGRRILYVVVRIVETASTLNHSEVPITRREEGQECEIVRPLSLVFFR